VEDRGLPATCPPLPEMPAHKLNAVSGVGRRVASSLRSELRVEDRRGGRAPGLLRHITARGIERCRISKDIQTKTAKPRNVYLFLSRTPNDNPFVELLFGTVKTAPEYPGRFLDRQQAVECFNRYFQWYNAQHLHSGIDYVTPGQGVRWGP